EGDPVDAAVLDVMLAGGLRDRIAAVDRVDRMIERDRLFQRLRAIAERRLKVDQPPDLIGLAGLRDVGAADPVGQRVGMQMVRFLVGGGDMNDDLRPKIPAQPVKDSLTRDAALDEAKFGMRPQIVAAPGRKIIDRETLTAARQKQIDQRRAEKPRTAG